MFFDPNSRLLYVGDPGVSSFDEINVHHQGRQLRLAISRRHPQRAPEQPCPRRVHLRRSNLPIRQPCGGDRGVVYHGQRLPALRDAFIFGDWLNGPIRALRYGGTNQVPVQQLLSETGVASFVWIPAMGMCSPSISAAAGSGVWCIVRILWARPCSHSCGHRRIRRSENPDCQPRYRSLRCECAFLVG